MSQSECGFVGQPDALIASGPTLKVLIGFDPDYRPEPNPIPNLPPVEHLALVDTGALESCIDSALAGTLGLPIVNRRLVSGVHGSDEVNVH